ncbi:hypothetical protein BDB00DRAFT_212503 [Zychaea mexicana]|uniref:uncharacterized protein n=1 Tax=Zychaea mexicana TaxID=64656 RepID=UPI0022FEFAC4|nr:uncharacterized protein BDB00DRAFT_212503 [Zychaea mexicana]KAI9495711.1 hypothetical protein BDB00DRAFT_212503 [Zychaea mexicana]
MVDLLKAFQSKSIPGACDYLQDYCDVYINTTVMSMEHARSLHSALPGILTVVFGSPTSRGWIHIENQPEHDAAIRRAFRRDGPFLKALMFLAKYPNYSYDMAPEAFSEDVRKALAAGATQYLPRLYTNCVHFEKRSRTGTSDIRESAIRQSTIFPRPLSGEYRVKFNIVQFFLHHVVKVATHNTPTIPVTAAPPSAFASRMSSTMSTMSNVATSSSVSASTNSSSLGGSRIAGPNSSATSLSNQQLHQQQQYNQQPRPRSIIGSVYEQLMKEYMRHFIPCGQPTDFHPAVGTFFLDECIETWIRNTWVAPMQKLGPGRMHFIALFVRYIVSGDLRRCYSDNATWNSYRMVYNSVKDHLYAMISRLAFNWARDDDYLQVISLWSLWTMPWMLGARPNGTENQTFRPIADSWAQFIMENVLFYIPLTIMFLQRIRTFTYPDIPLPPAPTTTAPFPHFHTQTLSMSTTARATATMPATPKPSNQIRITCTLINVFKAEGLVDFLSHVEQALVRLQEETTPTTTASAVHVNRQAIDVLAARYFGDQKNHVQAILKKTYDDLIQLNGGTWTCTNLFIKEASPRSKPLVESLDALDQASIPQPDGASRWGGPPSMPAKSAQYLKELQQASKSFAIVFVRIPLGMWDSFSFFVCVCCSSSSRNRSTKKQQAHQDLSSLRYKAHPLGLYLQLLLKKKKHLLLGFTTVVF